MGMLDGLIGQLTQANSQSGQTNLGGIVGSLLGNIMQGHNQDQNSALPSGLLAMLLPVVLAWVQQQGGVSNVVSSLTDAGLGAEAQSWISQGANQQISSQVISQLLGSEQVTQLAEKIGVSPQQIQSGVAALLPQVINHLTPSGHVANPEESDGLLNAALGKLGGLFG